MKQNKYFSVRRFTLLFCQDFLFHKKIYLLALVGLGIAIYAVTYLYIKTNNGAFYRQEDYIPLFLMYLMVVGAIIGTSFPALTNSITKSNYLLAPGSLLEKFIVQFLIRIVILIPIALILFWVGVHLAKATFIFFLPKNTLPYNIQDYHFIELFSNIPTITDVWALLFTIFSIASLLFAGCTLFNRVTLIKTLIVTSLVVFAVVCIFVILSHIFYSSRTLGFDIELPGYKICKEMYNIQFFLYLIGGLSWLFFLPLAYFKLKEKEV